MGGRDETGSTARLLLEPAPGGLSVVQDLLNTAPVTTAEVPDLLADTASAQAAVDAALRTWARQSGTTAPEVRVTTGDLSPLRQLRDLVRASLNHDDRQGAAHPVDAEITNSDGQITYGPRGDGAAAIASLVHLEMLLADRIGTLRRLKTCQNPACGAAFYDLSRNAARVWHDMRTCGNTMNLRASRARRRETAAD